MTTPIPQSVDTLASGRTSTASFITVIKDRSPTGNDGINGQYQVGQRWIDTSVGNAEYFLLSFISSNGVVQANWVLLESGTATTETLTGNSGPAVTPDGANNINVVGDGTTGLLFSGASHTLTGTLNAIPNSALANSTITLNAGNGISITGSPISLGGAATISADPMVPTSFTTDVGVATPVLNNLNVFGSGGISTTGIGDTIAIDGSGIESTLNFDTDSGTAIPAANTITVHGTGGISTSGAASTVTIDGSSIVNALTFAGDSGTATPSGGTITLHGTSGITTSASGSTVTFSGSGATGFTSINLRVFTSSGTYTPTAGTVYVLVEVVGGGGGGGGSAAVSGSNISCGAGGGGGGYAKSYLAVASASGQTVTVGAAGSGGVGHSSGTSGGTSSLGALVVATGGSGGAPSDTLPVNHSVPGTGGTGTVGQFLLVGSSGFAGFGSGNTSNGGNGGASALGGGILAGTANSNGYAGLAYGGGGGGAASEASGSAHTGGAGAKGVVVITEYIS